jgi:hypothetical protein
MQTLLTPLEARHRLVLGYVQGTIRPDLTTASMHFLRTKGTRGLSSIALNPEAIDATFFFGFALGLHELALGPIEPVTLFAPPTHVPLVKERVRAVLDGIPQARADARVQIRGWFERLRLVSRPWLVKVEPERWVAVGLDRASPILPPWVGPKLG